MPDIIRCPECQKALRLNADLAGKRVRCPGCKQPFVVPAAEDELEEVDDAAEESEEDEAGYQETPVARRRRPPAEEEVRPARRARRARDEEEAEEEEEERPRRKRRRRKERDYGREVTTSSTPLVLGILSIVLCCIPIVGIILGRFAMTKADEEMDRLPGGKRYQGPYKTMQAARVLGMIGMGLSIVLFVVAIVLKILDATH